MKRLKLLSMEAADSSVWLGKKLHFSDRNGRAQLQIRKDTIPVYLAGLGVVTADVTALGVTAATATLDHWVQLSTDAGGSDLLSALFPVINQRTDFELRSIFNEVLIQPQDDAPAGLTINQPTNGHPCLFFEGSSDVGAGYGLIQFASQVAAKSLIYHSRADENLTSRTARTSTSWRAR